MFEAMGAEFARKMRGNGGADYPGFEEYWICTLRDWEKQKFGHSAWR
jgi:hypothetical protein